MASPRLTGRSAPPGLRKTVRHRPPVIQIPVLPRLISCLNALALRGKVIRMNPNWAEDNLQTIRTLMERSAIYRRALAPIMLFAGVLGVAAAGLGLGFQLNRTPAFGALWLGTAALAVAGAFFIARRQALKDSEPFWSTPTRRVAQALLPPLAAGMGLGVLFGLGLVANFDYFTLILPFLWAFFYGCALHSAGFFMPRGMKWFGWLYIALACGTLAFLVVCKPDYDLNPHWFMGFFFGVLHLAYGSYLYFTEKKAPIA